jgi:phytoene desaturase
MAKAIVIGAGFGGIAAALRLRAKGYEVTLIDKQDKLGGRAYQYRRQTPLGTFVHDAGPTVITAKFLFDELFALFGKKREDYIEFRDIYPWYRIVFAAGRQEGTETRRHEAGFPSFDYGGTLQEFEAQIARFEPADVEGFRKYLAHSKKIFDVGFTELGDQPFDSFWTMLKCAPALVRLQNYKTVHGMAKKYIRNENLRRVFSFQPLLVGGNPFNTTSIYSLIFYLERQWGVQFAMGGTGALVAALERLMSEERIEIRLEEEVTALHVGHRLLSFIHPKTGKHLGHDVSKAIPIGPASIAHAKLASGEMVEGDIFVCNADTPYAYASLIDPKYRKGLAARRVNRKLPFANLRYSMGLFVLYFGTTKQYPDVAHHTIVLGREYRDLITKLFDTLELETEDLSVYLHRPTATDPSMAPPGCESFYCLVPVPNLLSGHDWAEWGPKVRDATVKYLEQTILPGLSQCIVDDFYVTPKHFEQNLNTMHGTGFSIQPIFSQSAWFRFHNKAPSIENLYFVGAGTHPGAGMPGVLCSAKVVDRLVERVKWQPVAATMHQTV